MNQELDLIYLVVGLPVTIALYNLYRRLRYAYLIRKRARRTYAQRTRRTPVISHFKIEGRAQL